MSRCLELIGDRRRRDEWVANRTARVDAQIHKNAPSLDIRDRRMHIGKLRRKHWEKILTPLRKYFVSQIERELLGHLDDSVSCYCSSCDRVHRVDIRQRQRLLLGDSLTHMTWTPEKDGTKDTRHWEYGTKSGGCCADGQLLFRKVFCEFTGGLDVVIALGTNDQIRNGYRARDTWEDLMDLVAVIQDHSDRSTGEPNTFKIAGLIMSPKLCGEIPFHGWNIQDPDLSRRGRQMILLQSYIHEFNSSEGHHNMPMFGTLGYRKMRRTNPDTGRLEFGKSLQLSHWRPTEHEDPSNILHPANFRLDFYRHRITSDSWSISQTREIFEEDVALSFLAWLDEILVSVADTAVATSETAAEMRRKSREQQASIEVEQRMADRVQQIRMDDEEDDDVLQLHLSEAEIDMLLS